VAARRELLKGYVYAPFRAHDLFDRTFGTELEPRVEFSVYDGEAADANNLLYTSGRVPDHTPERTFETTLLVSGHPWTVVFESRPEWEAGSFRRFAPMVFVAGLLVSMWLFWLASGQSRARAAAEAGNNAKSRFLATMSHELRTPLNAIGGYVDLMLLGIPGPVNEQQQKYLHRVQHAQQHLLGLINNVLNFAKLDAGRVTFAREPIRVADAVTDASTMMAQQAAAKGIEFRVTPGDDGLIQADPEKVRQILLNLYSNAVKFTAAGGSVRTTWRVNGDHADIEVADTGIGIEADRQENIFEPFLQVDADLTRQQQGTGLGLSISRELARGMGGDLRVESEIGRGSRFVVTLPLG
jgi:signal transduction histidine kinase